jgi:hypothetical protein
MKNVKRIEDEIKQMSNEELSAFRRWFLEYDAQVWDEEIERDVKAGKLDALANKALREHRSGKTKER